MITYLKYCINSRTNSTSGYSLALWHFRHLLYVVLCVFSVKVCLSCQRRVLIN